MVTLRFVPSGSDAPAESIFDLHVDQLDFAERMGSLFELKLLVRSRVPDLNLTHLLGLPVVVDVDEVFHKEVHAIIRSVRQVSVEETGASFYVLDLVPPMWLLTHSRDCRIFQDLTVPSIVEAVIARYGARIPALAPSLSGSYGRREHVAQYAESDWDFVLRLLSDEGITSYFDHRDGGRWTLLDDTRTATPRLEVALPYIASAALSTPSPCVRHVGVSARLEASVTQFDDYDYRRPGFDFLSRQTVEHLPMEDDLIEVRFGLERIPEGDEPTTQVRRHMDALRATARVFEVETNCAVPVGTRFQITGHPRADVARELLVVDASFHRDEHEARHFLHCIPATTPFRPARLRRPRVMGTQTATVAGAPPQEIDVDAMGRVLLHFHWDQRSGVDAPSRRVRVSQAWAGPGYGLSCTPRIGDEVVVEYLDDDPDQPLIVGRVHNARSPSPLQLPQEKTHSVWRSRSTPAADGHNEIRLDDSAGQEWLRLRGQRNLEIVTGNDRIEATERDRTMEVKRDETRVIGRNQRTRVRCNHRLRVRNRSHVTAKRLHLEAESRLDATSEVHDIQARALQVAVADAEVAAEHVVVSASKIRLVGDGCSIELGPGGISIQADGNVTVNGALIKLNC